MSAEGERIEAEEAIQKVKSRLWDFVTRELS